MARELIFALRACIVSFIVCAVAYPALVWGAAQLLFPARAGGSLIFSSDGQTLIGSELIAQNFESDRYFHPRPSATSYKADAAGASNLGPNSPDLRKAVVERVSALKATPENPAPVDLVLASGSGLDPDISPEAARFQAPRVAAARGLSEGTVRELIERQTNRSGAILGAPPRVNVLLLNRALDAQQDASARTAGRSSPRLE